MPSAYNANNCDDSVIYLMSRYEIDPAHDRDPRYWKNLDDRWLRNFSITARLKGRSVYTADEFYARDPKVLEDVINMSAHQFKRHVEIAYMEWLDATLFRFRVIDTSKLAEGCDMGAALAL